MKNYYNIPRKRGLRKITILWTILVFFILLSSSSISVTLNNTSNYDDFNYGEKETKYTTEIEAKTGPDVFHLHAYSIKSFIEKGYVLDMSRFVNAEGSGFIDAWYAQTVDLMKKDNKYFAMPGDFMSMVLYYNKNLYKVYSRIFIP